MRIETAVYNGMPSKPGILIAAIIIGIAAGIGLGIYKVLNDGDGNDSGTYACLIKNQAVVDLVDKATIWEWFQKNRTLAKGKAFFFLAKPSSKTSKMFALNRVPNGLDVDHCLLQCVVDEATDLPVAIRMISFSTINEKLAAVIKEKGYIILSEDAFR